MDKLIEKVQTSVEIVDSISTYYDEFRTMLSDKKIMEELDERIKKTIYHSRDKLAKRLKIFESSEVDKLDFKETATLIFQTYQLFQEYEHIIALLEVQLNAMNVFARPDIILSEISRSKLTEISRKCSKLGLLIANFKKQYEHTNVDIIKTMSDKVLGKMDNSSSNTNEILLLQELFRKYPYTIDIYSIILQTTMDQNKSLITRIIQMIEQDKTFILDDFKSDYEKLEVKPVKNMAHRFFRLVPSNVSKPLKELFNYIDDTKDVEDCLESIVKKEGISIIYMKKFTANPIEFAIWKLTKLEEAAKFIQLGAEKNTGMNEKLIERMKIINYIEKPEKHDKWNLSEYVLYGDHKTDMFYILDSFNNKTFRFLKPWTNAGNKVPRSYLIGLLSYMGYIKGNSRDRISIYNELQERDIMNHLFLRHPVDVEALVADVQADMDAPKLKQELAGIITDTIKTPKNWYELGGVVHNADLIDEFANGIIKLYPKHFKDSLALDKRVQFPFSETISTFLVELNNVKKSFGRSLHERYVKTHRDVQQTAFRSVDNTKYFIKQLIRDSLDDVITNKSNVYSTLLMKNKILTIELNESDIDKKVGGYDGELYI